MVGAAIGQSVNQPGVAVEGEDDGPVDGEQAVEIAVGQSMRVFGVGLQAEQIHDIDEAQLDVRELLA